MLQQKLAALDKPTVTAPLDVSGSEAALLGAASSSTLSGQASSAGAYQMGACAAAGIALLVTWSGNASGIHQRRADNRHPSRRWH